MRISTPRAAVVDGRRRIEADVVFEDVDREPLRAWIEVEPPLGDALEPLPEVFVLAALPAAAWLGERRLRVDGPLDAQLASGLEQAVALLASWYPHCVPVALEPTGGPRTLRPAAEPHAAALCSGGVDTLAMLRENWTACPAGHPARIRTTIYTFGYTSYELEDGVAVPERLASYDRNAARLEAFCAGFDCSLSRVHTNLALLCPDTVAYMDAGHSAALLAPLLAAPTRITDAWIASSGAGVDWPPHGSHPMLDVLYATGATRVHMGQPLVSRHAKVGQIAAWEPAYDVVHPCSYDLDAPAGQVNCGHCEKCVRTMLSLVAWGALERFSAFPADDVDLERIARTPQNRRIHFMNDPEMVGHLRAAGRDDLVAALERWGRRRSQTRWGKRVRKLGRSLRKRLGSRPTRETPRPS